MMNGSGARISGSSGVTEKGESSVRNVPRANVSSSIFAFVLISVIDPIEVILAENW